VLRRWQRWLRIFSKEFDALVAQKLNDPDWKFPRFVR
jgi:hypothetical protein